MSATRRAVVPRLSRGVVLPAIGPCMFAAPLVLVVAIVGVLCWPFVAAAAVVLWLVGWCLERVAVAIGVRRAAGASAGLRRLMWAVLTPWSVFEAPEAALPSSPGPGTASRPPSDPASPG